LYGVDLITSGGKPYVVDINTFPGFKGVPNAAELLAAFIEEAM
jgi:glutathione synthase/RimK-type ligase-like ATP-grasp enzyme